MRDRKKSFYKILNKRITKLQNCFLSIRKLANKSNYIFDIDDVNSILQIVESETDLLKNCYNQELELQNNNLRQIMLNHKTFITIDELEQDKFLNMKSGWLNE